MTKNTKTPSPLKGTKRKDGPHPSQAWFEGTLRARKDKGISTKDINTFKKLMLERHSHLKTPKTTRTRTPKN